MNGAAERASSGKRRTCCGNLARCCVLGGLWCGGKVRVRRPDMFCDACVMHQATRAGAGAAEMHSFGLRFSWRTGGALSTLTEPPVPEPRQTPKYHQALAFLE